MDTMVAWVLSPRVGTAGWGPARQLRAKVTIPSETCLPFVQCLRIVRKLNIPAVFLTRSEAHRRKVWGLTLLSVRR